MVISEFYGLAVSKYHRHTSKGLMSLDSHKLDEEWISLLLRWILALRCAVWFHLCERVSLVPRNWWMKQSSGSDLTREREFIQFQLSLFPFEMTRQIKTENETEEN